MNQQDLNISEAEYERQSRQTAWIVSIVFHLCALLPLAFITCSAPGGSEDLTQIVGWGGSGGNPDVDAPLGEAPKGDPNATGGSRAAAQEPQKTTQTNAQQPKTDPKTLNTDPASTSSTTSSQTTDTKQTSSSSSSTEGREGDQSGEAKGQPDGKGTKPAGGSGGASVGGENGLGRCWETSPTKAARGATATEEGRVTLSATVKWDGRVTGISKGSGSTTLFNKARALLSRAKACRAAPGTPDVTVTLTYTFHLD